MPQPPPPKVQSQWNSALKSNGRKTIGPRSSLKLFQSTPNTEGESSTSKLQPAGIIDLECYTSIHRTKENASILELSGDDSLNPDLRSFYFCADSAEHGDEWTQALLGERHVALVDEREAYRQVCDGFAMQLQELHEKLDTAQQKHEEAQDDMYRTRSEHEEVRRQCARLIQEALERESSSEFPLAQTRRAYRTDLETVRQQDMGISSAVQLLCDYTSVLEDSCTDMNQKLERQNDLLQKSQVGGSRQKKELDALLQAKEREWKVEKETYQHQIERLEQQLAASQKLNKDAQQELAAKKMEFTVYQTSTKSKIQEISSHKKILKKEVVELRQKLDMVGGEIMSLQSSSKNSKKEVQQERRKSELLERYVERMESQVRVQQNMMEIMSQSGLSQNGCDAKSLQSDLRHSGHRETRQDQIVLVNTPSDVDDDSNRCENHSQLLRKAMEEDAKSHMSELTEDPLHKLLEQEQLSPTSPPRRIRPTVPLLPPRASDRSVSSAGSSRIPPSNPGTTTQVRLSVAQRARLDAEKRSTTVKVRVPPSQLMRSNSQSSFFSTFSANKGCASDDGSSADGALSLAGRQQLQRAQQMAFLKGQGLVG